MNDLNIVVAPQALVHTVTGEAKFTHGVCEATIAAAWFRTTPVVVGASSTGQIDDAVEPLSITLSDAENEQLESAATHATTFRRE